MRILVALMAMLIAPLPVWGGEVVFPQGAIVVHTPASDVPFTVEIASNTAQYERGLMFRKEMPRNHGMLFIFPKAGHIDMWMKDTYIPLDMVFMDEKGTIRQVVKSTVPESTAIISSREDAKYVLELNAGAADYYHIAPGSRMTGLPSGRHL